jgi:hypothetical protein
VPDFDEGPVPMTPLKRFAAGAAVAALLASGAACTNDDPVTQPTTAPSTTTATPSPSVSATPSPTATPTPTLSQRAQAEADAIAMVKRYYALSDKLAAKPPALAETKQRLGAAATSYELAYAIVDIGDLRTAKEHQTGAVAVRSPSAEKVDLTYKPTARPPRTPVIKVRFCMDVSGIDLLDATGKSIANPKRQMRRVAHAEVVNTDWPSRGGWRVAKTSDEETEC